MFRLWAFMGMMAQVRQSGSNYILFAQNKKNVENIKGKKKNMLGAAVLLSNNLI